MRSHAVFLTLLLGCQSSDSMRAVRVAERFVFALTAHSDQGRNEACEMLDAQSVATLTERAQAAVALGASRAEPCDFLLAFSSTELSEHDRAHVVRQDADAFAVRWGGHSDLEITIVRESGELRVRLPELQPH